MTTFSDTIEETMRRLMPSQLDLSGRLVNGLDGVTEAISLHGPMVNAVSYGMTLACEMELMYVTDWDPIAQNGMAIRGAFGSQPAPHGINEMVYQNPKFTRFDIGVAVNQELQALSAEGLFRLATQDIMYNPTFQGYDLPSEGLIDVLGVRWKQVVPTRNYPPIHGWAVLPRMTDTSYFPSGQSLVIYEAGHPGLPVHVWYSASFNPLVDLDDDLTGVAGLPPTATDIVSVGAQIISVHAREIKRNFTEAQPDPRKAPEVPPAAIMNSTKALESWRASRIADERNRLKNQLKYLTVKRIR
jgi:hypothetical protein